MGEVIGGLLPVALGVAMMTVLLLVIGVVIVGKGLAGF